MSDDLATDASRRSSLIAKVLRQADRLWLAVRIYVLLIVARGIIKLLTLERISERLGHRLVETPAEPLPEDQARYARRIARGICRLAPLTPTNSNCYPQALTAWWLLHRRGIPSTFYYGAAFDEDGTALQAHTWIRCGQLIVTGGGGHLRRFAPLIWFADNWRAAERPEPARDPIPS